MAAWSWGRGFRAPSIAESGTAGLAFGQGNTNDPVLCPGGVANVKGTFNALCSYPAVGVEAANPDLKAVESINSTVGFIFEPFKQFSVSVDLVPPLGSAPTPGAGAERVFRDSRAPGFPKR